jgi:hypothetical protein
MAALSSGCSAELKAKVGARLPKLLAIDEKSLIQMRAIAEQIGLKPQGGGVN